MLELLVVVAIVGLIGAIVAPMWFGFLESKRLSAGSDELYGGLRSAQTQAQHRQISWQFSLRERNGLIEWATHKKSTSPSDAQWKTLASSSLQIDSETTFAQSGGVYYVRFDEDGNVQYRLGRITLSSTDMPELKRCVIVSTLIGAMRRSKEQAEPRDGKMCY